MMKRWMGLLACLALSQYLGQVQAASFDCAKAGTKVEKLICADTELSKQNDDLKSAYQAVYTLTADRAALKWVQRDWLKARNACKDTACVKQAYQTRQTELEKAKAEPKPCFRLLERQWPEVQSGHYPVCLAYLKNLNRFCGEPPPTCELKLDPAIKELSLPTWEPVDPKANLDRIAERVKWWNPFYPPDEKLWEVLKPEILNRLDQGLVHMWRARFNLTNDGVPAFVMRIDLGCAPILVVGSDGAQYTTRSTSLGVVDEHTGKLDTRYGFMLLGKSDIFLYGGRSYVLDPSDGSGKFYLYEPYHVSVTDTVNADSVCVFQYLK